MTYAIGNVLDVLPTLDADRFQCCVTSPPYWGLRDYGHAEQLGLEATPAEYVANMVRVFREVRRVLRPDGVLWLNIGDSYAAGCMTGTQGSTSTTGRNAGQADGTSLPPRKPPEGMKPKDLVGIPWSVAFALRADGWYLRSDTIWCLSGGAWVYARTQKGDMPMMVKDLVRLNPSTVRLWNGEKWTRVLGWNASADTSERIELTLRSGERIGCTGGHQWPTQRGNVRARDLVAGDVIATCNLPEPANAAAPGYLSTEVCWLAGLYLAEGSRGVSSLQLTLHADEQAWLPRIEAVARHFGGSMTFTVDGNNLAVRLYGRVLAAVIDSIIGGATAHDKHLRAESWRLPNAHLRAVAQGYLDGDGHDDKANGRIRLSFARNYALERDLRTLSARLGATLTLNLSTATCEGKTFPTFRGEWRWSRSGHHNERDRGEIVAIGRSKARRFWDIGVEDEPHLFALASGVLTHNSKPNPMPESVTDRPTKAHEYVFLLSKSERYYYDAEAVAEPVSQSAGALAWRKIFDPAKQGKEASMKDAGVKGGNDGARDSDATTRNARSVWTIASQPFAGAHFATMPPKLAERCILAGSRIGDEVLDPFLGSGTVGMVAESLGRRWFGVELNAAYEPLIKQRTAQVGLFGRTGS